MPSELLSMVIKEAGVQPTRDSIANVGSRSLHEAWQQAVSSLDTRSSDLFTDRDVQLLKKFKNLQQLSFQCNEAGSRGRMNGWQLVRALDPILAPAEDRILSKLHSLHLHGSSSYKVLDVLQRSQQLRTRITALQLDDPEYNVTPKDLRCLSDLSALAELLLRCSRLPPQDLQGLTAASNALSSTLKSLTLDTSEHVRPAAMAVFPGQLTSLTKLHLGRQEGVVDDDEELRAEQGSACVAAVSALVNLQDLHIGAFRTCTAEQQQQALADLLCLTRMSFPRYHKLKDNPKAAFIPAADTLVVLDAAAAEITGKVADALFSMPALRRVLALILLPSEVWRGKVAQGSRIEELKLCSKQHDVNLQNLPTLPALKRFCLQPPPPPMMSPWLWDSNDRYQHLAGFLQRHAATLESIYVGTSDEFGEALPDLPACRQLSLFGMVGPDTLCMLSRTKLPALQELRMGAKHMVPSAQHPELELAWLAELPALRSLEMKGASQGVQSRVRSLFAGRPGVTLALKA